MDFVLIVSIMILILLPLCLGIVIPIYKNHNSVTGKTINYDSSMKKYVYRINLTYSQIIDLLSNKSDLDILSCAFDFERSVIRFSDYTGYKDYCFHIQEFNGFCIMRLEQSSSIGLPNQISYQLNPFMVAKLQAELVPFSRFGF